MAPVMDKTSIVAGAPLVTDMWEFILGLRTELFLFCVAVVAYQLLFGHAQPTRRTTKGKSAGTGKVKQVCSEHECSIPDVSSPDQVQRAFNAAFEKGDHRQVLRLWGVVKTFDSAPNVSLARVVESMQRLKKDSTFIVREVQAFVTKYPGQCDDAVVNDLLESVARRLDSELVEQIIQMLGAIDIRPDQRTYEILLNMNFSLRNFAAVRSLAFEMKARQISLTTRATLVVIKTALKTNELDEAMLHFRRLKSVWKAEAEESTSPSTAPQHIIAQIVDLACKEHQLGAVVPLLLDVSLTDELINVMLQECVHQKDSSLAQKVDHLAREQGVPLSDATYSILVKSVSDDVSRVQEVLDDVVAKRTQLTPDFAFALLAACSRTNNVTLASRLFEYMKPKDRSVLEAFIRFYCDTAQFDKACDVYDQHVCGGSPELGGLQLDARVERLLMDASVRCGRERISKKLMDASPSDVARHITMIRKCTASGDLEGAQRVFRSLKSSGTELNSVVYNTVLDACVACGDVAAAEDWMRQTREAGMVDVVSYNTLIKLYLYNGNIAKARQLMDRMRAEALQPNRITYNELVSCMVKKGSNVQRADVWRVVEEMREANMQPNQVTCSILLRSLTSSASQKAIEQTMNLIDSMEEPMDEVLLSSVVEACVRIGKPDLLASKLKQFSNNGGCAITGSHTFGSLIKAYGHAKDINGIWRCWKEMRSRHIRPTSITLGCMVEAVVTNGDTEGAYELIREVQKDVNCCTALNSVIYCSVLKGFCHEKKLPRVLAVYAEMTERNVDVSIVTFNTVLDACARCARMDRVPAILEDMRRNSVSPNIITYGTMLKGHCQAGGIMRAFEILEEMKRETNLRPDEIMYNSLLDGCAQNNLVEEGLKVLEDMQAQGVAPSNFTLSLIVKLMNRTRKLDKAFVLVQDICAKYAFRPNVHVYTNLIQACIANRHLPRAMSTFSDMLDERVVPDSRTYVILVRACLAQGRLEEATELLRLGLGLSAGASADCLKVSLPHGKDKALCPNLDYAIVGETLSALTEKGAPDLAVSLLADTRHSKPQVRIEPSVQRAVMSGSVLEGSATQVPSGCDRPWSRQNGAVKFGTMSRSARPPAQERWR